MKYKMSILKNLDKNVYQNTKLELQYICALHIPFILMILTFVPISMIVFGNVFSEIQFKYLISIELAIMFLGLYLLILSAAHLFHCIKAIQNNIPEKIRSEMDQMTFIKKEKGFLNKKIINKNFVGQSKKRL